MTEEAKLAADTLRKMANFKQFLALPQDTGKIINACADLIESLSEQLEQVTRERDAETELLGKLIVILKKYPQAATNHCAYDAYSEIKKWMLNMRGVQGVEK